MNNSGFHRQPRFGSIPLLGFLLANLFSNSAVAKFAPQASIRLSYDPVPGWLNPQNHHNYHHDQQYWHPIGPPASVANPEASELHEHHHVQPANQQQIVHIHHRPSEIIIDNGESVTTETSGDVAPTITEAIPHMTNRDYPTIDEYIAAESRGLVASISSPKNHSTTLGAKTIVKRGTQNRYKVRKNNKYMYQKQRRTTTPDYDYDSYEDFSATTRRYPSKRRARPTRRSAESYEYRDSNSYGDNASDYDDYTSYELTTKPYKKRRRTTTQKPKRKQTKNNNRQRQHSADSEYYEDDDENNTEKIQPTTQTKVLKERQRQDETTTPLTLISSGVTSSTTTEASTTTTTSTIANSTNTTGYGYGPSNGNEGISITYGPPTGGSGSQDLYGPPRPGYGLPSDSFSPSIPAYNPPNPSYGPPSTSYGVVKPSYGVPTAGYYQVPFNDWYSNEVSKNSIVKKVHDIIGFENVFQ